MKICMGVIYLKTAPKEKTNNNIKKKKKSKEAIEAEQRMGGSPGKVKTLIKALQVVTST